MASSKHWIVGKSLCTKHGVYGLPCWQCVNSGDPDLVYEETREEIAEVEEKARNVAEEHERVQALVRTAERRSRNEKCKIEINEDLSPTLRDVAYDEFELIRQEHPGRDMWFYDLESDGIAIESRVR